VIIPDRPDPGEATLASWGQPVHDAVFTPVGAICNGAAVGVVRSSSTSTQLPIDAAIDDPGGWVDTVGNRMVAPPDADGLYVVMATFNSVGGAQDDGVRGILVVNGVTRATALAESDGGVNVVWNIVMLLQLQEGDVITFAGQNRGSGATPNVSLNSGAVVRIGAALGS
jgi:hypothetical protein